MRFPFACARVRECPPVRSWGDTAARPRPQGKRRNPSLADELVAVKLERLGRSTRDVYNPVYNLGAKGAAFTALEPSFLREADPCDRAGDGREMERKLIRKRQQARIEAARRKAFIGVVSRRCYSPRSARCAMLVRDQPPSPKPSRSRAGAYLWACSSLLVCSRTWVSVWGVVISFVQSGVVNPEHNSVTHR